jgi:hypothetical protein
MIIEIKRKECPKTTRLMKKTFLLLTIALILVNQAYGQVYTNKEVGFLGTRNQVMGGIQYRFGL